MKTFSARYRGNRLVELVSDVHLAEDAAALVVIPDPADNSEDVWRRLAAAQFLKGYGESDAVYDEI